MPAAANTFQQIAGSDPGPFTQYLRPHIPIDYGQVASTPLTNTGYEDTMTGVGKGVLNFLEGVSKERRRKAELDDADTQTGIDQFQKHVAAMLANPDLTDEGRQAIQNEADAIMNQHMHYAMKDVPKDGVHGFIKNILTQATGGGIKVREPINWNEATGRITNVREPGHSQSANFTDIVARGQAAIDAMKKAKAEYIDPVTKLRRPQPITADEMKEAWAPFYREMMAKAPSYADKFWGAAGAGGIPGGGTEWVMKFAAPGHPADGEAAQPEVPATEQPPTYTPKAIPDTGVNYRPQPPLTASAMPLPPGISGALIPPSPDYTPRYTPPYVPGPTADTGMRNLTEPQLKAANIIRGPQHPLDVSAMPLTGMGNALVPLPGPDFTRPNAGAAPRTTAGPGPAIGSTVKTKDGGTFKIRGKNPDGTYDAEQM